MDSAPHTPRTLPEMPADGEFAAAAAELDALAGDAWRDARDDATVLVLAGNMAVDEVLSEPCALDAWADMWPAEDVPSSEMSPLAFPMEAILTDHAKLEALMEVLADLDINMYQPFDTASAGDVTQVLAAWLGLPLSDIVSWLLQHMQAPGEHVRLDCPVSAALQTMTGWQMLCMLRRQPCLWFLTLCMIQDLHTG